MIRYYVAVINPDYHRVIGPLESETEARSYKEFIGDGLVYGKKEGRMFAPHDDVLVLKTCGSNGIYPSVPTEGEIHGD